MELKKVREYQTIRLFATLGFLTLLVVLLFKVVLFAPHQEEKFRVPAQQSDMKSTVDLDANSETNNK